MNNIFKYWGKAKQDENGGWNCHLLPYHCLDVAAVGRVLLESQPVLIQQLSKLSGIPAGQLLPWLLFLISIHDLGKFSDGFQSLQPDLLQRLQSRTTRVGYPHRHDTLGYYFCYENLSRILSPETDENDLNDLLKPWLTAVTGHHGQPPKVTLTGIFMDTQFPQQVKQDTICFINGIINLLLPKGIPFGVDKYDYHYRRFTNTSWLVAGLTVVADWIGSNQDWFPHNDKSMLLIDYWHDIALPQAKKAVTECGLTAVDIAPFSDMRMLFPAIATATPLQQLVEKMELAQGQQLFIIEEVTGGGKTESALTLVHRLMADGLADGLFLGLPTMATANAMHERVEAMYRRLFDDASNPSLVLAHSTARMVLKMEEKNKMDRGYGIDEDSASQNCSAWLSDSRKKALLANVGVGTIDQVLLAVLSARYQSLRLFGLSRKVLIVDEVHACDTYMLKLLGALLRFHAAFGGSAILLSATLPQTIRAQLLKSFASGADILDAVSKCTDYPLLTCLSRDGLKEIPVAARKDTCRAVTVQPLHHFDEVIKQLQAVIEAGGCACWVRNTVYDAVEAYRHWIKSFGMEHVRLFHARFALGDRLQIEQDVKSLFGPESTTNDRKGQLLIATQVVEQSLDIDFDYMVTDLAPVDLIIQRTGRLKRHSRDRQGNLIKGSDERDSAILGVLMPEALDNADKNWYKEMFPKAHTVYPHHGQLWLTAHWLQRQKKFVMPEDAREMIETVYSEDASQFVPDGLKKVEIEAEGKNMADASLGRLNSLKFDEGYRSTMNQWQDDTIALTRLGEITMMVRLCRLVNGQIKPLINNNWELSQLSMRQLYISKESSEFEAEIKMAKQSMPDEGRHCVLIPLLESAGEKWVGKALNKQGETVQIEYDNRIGLQIKGGDTNESD